MKFKITEELVMRFLAYISTALWVYFAIFRTDDILLLSNLGFGVLAFYAAIGTSQQIRTVIGTLWSRGALFGEPATLERLEEILRFRRTRGSCIGAVVVAATLAFSEVFSRCGYFVIFTEMTTQYCLSQQDSDFMELVLLLVFVGIIAGWRLGSLGVMADLPVSARNIGLTLEYYAGDKDGYGGLGVLFKFLRNIGLLSLIPVVWTATLILLTSISDSFMSYSHYRPLFFVIFILAFAFAWRAIVLPVRIVDNLAQDTIRRMKGRRVMNDDDLDHIAAQMRSSMIIWKALSYSALSASAFLLLLSWFLIPPSEVHTRIVVYIFGRYH